MIINRVLKALFSIILIIFVISSCATNKFEIQTSGNALKTAKEKDIRLTLKFLDEKTMIDRFGKEDNPFLSPPSALSLNKIMVFELNISNLSKEDLNREVMLQLNQIELQFVKVNKHPINQFHLKQFWEMKSKNSNYKISLLIKNNVVQNKLVLKEESNYKGLLVFIGNFPNYGDAKVYVPVFREDGRLIHNFKFDFSF